MLNEVFALSIITEVRLERFKAAFKPKQVPLRPFNVLIGRNGSGKSTLVEALQWVDTAMRRDAREACVRYWGIHDLINLRGWTKTPFFQLTLTWDAATTKSHGEKTQYSVKVEESDSTPLIAAEDLSLLSEKGRTQARFITTSEPGHRIIHPFGDDTQMLSHFDTDRLALATAPASNNESAASPLTELRDFWKRAVFLRLSPSRLSEGSPARRKSFEPMLDEEGQNLPALINELTDEQREEMVENIRGILPGIQDVEVSGAAPGRDTRVNYSLMELMPYRGRGGKSRFPIPAWMLSEGTRRITALLALLAHDPPPSLLCIEEIENGLDPWTVKGLLNHLRSAQDRGTQVILTTHSPWLLDHVDMQSILRVRRAEGETVYEHFASLAEVRRFAKSIPAGTRYTHMES